MESYKLLLPGGGSFLRITLPPDSLIASRLNSLWFCSLIIALSTIAFGIQALQWLTEHDTYYGLHPREALSVYEMRSKAFRNWRVPEFISLLPILVLIAILLFLVGLVDFLWASNKVAAPIAFLAYVIIGISTGYSMLKISF